MSLEDVAAHAGHKVLMEVDHNIWLIVCDPQKDFRPTAQASPNALIKYNYCYYCVNLL
jgi:hypothetical protein